MMRKMMMACCSILVWGLVACGEKKAETSQDQKTEVEQTAKTEDEVVAKTDTEETVDEPDDGKSAEPISLSDLQKTLVKQTLQVPKSISDPKARDFAQVFCEKYPAFGANALLLKYLQNPKAFNPKATVSMTLSTENAKIVDDRPNGFLKCEKYALFDNQDDETFEACRWMRKNGHSLVGVFMHSSNDAGLNHHAYAFYDFDPASNMMIPDKDALDAVAYIIEEFSGDDIVIRLPQKGKDLEIESIELRDGDVYNSALFTLIWTGDKLQREPLPH